MTIKDVAALIEQLAPLSYQESYDNSGLIVTSSSMEKLKGILLCIDVTPEVVDEAINKGLNLVISHHPLIFNGLKKITGKNFVEKTLINALKNDISLYAAHTNLDNVQEGVNTRIADKLGIINQKILVPVNDELTKLVTFVPSEDADDVRMALFESGAGQIGNYDLCSYNLEGSGSFRGGENTNPHVGAKGKLHFEKEIRIEVIVPKPNLPKVIKALLATHPYEEVAYDIYPLLNSYSKVGTGVIGDIPTPIEEKEFLNLIKSTFNSGTIRYTSLLGKPISKVAICGGSGASFLNAAISAGADIFISADFKYHQFFEAEKKIIIADIGHFESEQYTVDIFYEYLIKNLPKFAVFKSEINTNPINYL